MNDSTISLEPYMSLDMYEEVIERKTVPEDEQRNRASTSRDGERDVLESIHLGDITHDAPGGERHKDIGVVSAARDHDAGGPPQPSSKAVPANIAAAEKPTRRPRRPLLSLALILLLFAILFNMVASRRWTHDSSDVAVSAFPGFVFDPPAPSVDATLDINSTEINRPFAEPDASSEPTEPVEPTRQAAEPVKPEEVAKSVAPPIHSRFTKICLFSTIGSSRSAARKNQMRQAGRGCQLLLHCCAGLGRDFKIEFDDNLKDEKFLFDLKADKKSSPAIAILVIRKGRDPFLNHATAVQFAWTVADWCVENNYDRVYLSSCREDDISLDLIGYVKSRLLAFDVSFGLALPDDRPDVQSISVMLGTDALLTFRPGYGNLMDHSNVVSDAMHDGGEELCHVPRFDSVVDDVDANNTNVGDVNETLRDTFPSSHGRVREKHSERIPNCRGLRFM